MTRSKRSLEGYLMIDDRANGGGMREVPVLTCCHCQRQIIVNPLRTRDRNHCRKCDAYVCDQAECVLECNGGFRKVLDDLQERDEKKLIIPF